MEGYTGAQPRPIIMKQPILRISLLNGMAIPAIPRHIKVIPDLIRFLSLNFSDINPLMNLPEVIPIQNIEPKAAAFSAATPRTSTR